jgi:hypothetical protein
MAEVKICVGCTIFSHAQQWFGIGNQGMYFAKGCEIILN